MSDPTKEQMRQLLEPLISQAEAEGKWLHCSYQDLWFSPAQLREENRKGSFLWGPVNWTLRDPQERLAEAQRRADSAVAYAQRVKQEIAG